MAEPAFWNDQAGAQKVMQRRKRVENDLALVRRVCGQEDDAKVIVDWLEAGEDVARAGWLLPVVAVAIGLLTGIFGAAALGGSGHPDGRVIIEQFGVQATYLALAVILAVTSIVVLFVPSLRGVDD